MGSPATSMNQASVTRSNCPGRNGGALASASTEESPGSGGCGGRVPPQHGVVGDGLGRSGIHGARAAARLMRAAASRNWQIEVEVHGQSRPQGLVQVVGEASATGTEHQPPRRCRAFRKACNDRIEARAILRITPAPVTVQVRVVRSEALADRERGSKRDMHGMRLAAALDAERIASTRGCCCLVLEGSGQVFDARASRAGRGAFKRGALSRSFRRVVREQVMQAAAPFRQRQPRLRHQPESRRLPESQCGNSGSLRRSGAYHRRGTRAIPASAASNVMAHHAATARRW